MSLPVYYSGVCGIRCGTVGGEGRGGERCGEGSAEETSRFGYALLAPGEITSWYADMGSWSGVG